MLRHLLGNGDMWGVQVTTKLTGKLPKDDASISSESISLPRNLPIWCLSMFSGTDYEKLSYRVGDVTECICDDLANIHVAVPVSR